MALPQTPGPVLVTGGTGHLGRELVRELLVRGKQVRVLARRPGTNPRVEWATGDLATGEGVAVSLRGIHTVIHAATLSPIAQRGSVRLKDLITTPRTVDVEGTARLLEECAAAGVQHFLHVSIAGLHAEGPLPYNRAKLEGENLVRASDLPWSIVHATPFFYLLSRLLGRMEKWPFWVLPDARIQPVCETDVARYVAGCADDGQRGVRESIGGPEAKPFTEFARDYLDARGRRKWIASLQLSEARAKRLGLVAGCATTGGVRWKDWLAAR